jgi:hypothetical protein
VVYTAITDGYKLHPVINPGRGWDFICFSEASIRCRGWDVRRIERRDIVVENGVKTNDKAKTTKRIKILPHLFVRDYHLSIWIDSSIQFKEEIDLDALVADFIASPSLMRVRAHPYRSCIYSEAEEVARRKLDTRQSVEALVARYRREQFPDNFGLTESNFVLRKHRAEAMVGFDEAWWRNVRQFSRRDQLSFDYVRWKHPIEVSFIDDRVDPQIEKTSHGRDRGPFFNSIFNFFPVAR